MTQQRNKTILNKQFTKSKSISADFVRLEFEATIRDKGYDVIWSRAIACSCKSPGNDHNSTCKNCGGSGWLFVNPTKTRAILTSIDVNRSYDTNGVQDFGKVMVTMSNEDKIAHLDRIEIINSEAEHGEVYHSRINSNTGELFIFTRYTIKSVYYIGLFQDDDSPLMRLTEENGDFSFIDNKIIFADKYKNSAGVTFSVRYSYAPVYHIWDITHDARNSLVNGGRDVIKLPVQGIGKRAHLIAELENFEGDRLLDNSFEETMANKETDTSVEKVERLLKYTDTQLVFDLLTDKQKRELATICQSNALPLEIPIKMI